MVELSKRDIWSPQRVAQERPDLAYHLLAIDFLPPLVLSGRLQWLAGVLAQGAVQPLQSVVYGLGDTQAALRHMAQAKHMGADGCFFFLHTHTHTYTHIHT